MVRCSRETGNGIVRERFNYETRTSRLLSDAETYPAVAIVLVREKLFYYRFSPLSIRGDAGRIIGSPSATLPVSPK